MSISYSHLKNLATTTMVRHEQDPSDPNISPYGPFWRRYQPARPIENIHPEYALPPPLKLDPPQKPWEAYPKYAPSRWEEMLQDIPFPPFGKFYPQSKWPSSTSQIFRPPPPHLTSYTTLPKTTMDDAVTFEISRNPKRIPKTPAYPPRKRFNRQKSNWTIWEKINDVSKRGVDLETSLPPTVEYHYRVPENFHPQIVCDDAKRCNVGRPTIPEKAPKPPITPESWPSIYRACSMKGRCSTAREKQLNHLLCRNKPEKGHPVNIYM